MRPQAALGMEHWVDSLGGLRTAHDFACCRLSADVLSSSKPLWAIGLDPKRLYPLAGPLPYSPLYMLSLLWTSWSDICRVCTPGGLVPASDERARRVKLASPLLSNNHSSWYMLLSGVPVAGVPNAPGSK